MMKPLSLNTTGKFPKKKLEIHEIAFWHYWSQGIERTLQKTADYCNVALSTVKTWSQAFKWRDRLLTEVDKLKNLGVLEVWGDVGKFRKDGVTTVKHVMGWLRGMTDIIEDSRVANRPLSNEEKVRLSSYRECLKEFGITLKTPRDLKDLVGVISELVDVKPGAGGGTMGTPPERGKPEGGNIQVQGSALIIMGLGEKGQVQALPMRDPLEVAQGDPDLQTSGV